MNIHNEAEMAIGDTQKVIQAATAWMGSFIASDQRKDTIIRVSLPFPATSLDPID